MRRLLILLIAVCLLFCLSCRKSSVPVFVLSFNGTLESSLRTAPLHPVSARYAGYLHRKVLYVEDGEPLTYDVSQLKLRAGTAQFWIKVDALPQGSAIPVVQLGSTDNPRLLEIAMKRKGLQILYNRNVHRLDWQMPRRVWMHVAISWDSSVHGYLDGQEQPLETVSSENRAAKDVSRTVLRIGGARREESEIASYKLRDFELHDVVQDTSEIRHTYEKGNSVRKLVWRTADLNHFAGIKVRDSGAAGGEAWTSDPQMAFLDGLRLPEPGAYQLIWRFKPRGKILPGTIECEVWEQDLNGGKRSLAMRTNHVNEFTTMDEYQDFSMNFQTRKDAVIGYEMRSFMPIRHMFLLDTVTIRSQSGRWQDIRRGEELKHTQGGWEQDPEAAKGKAWGNQNTLAYGPYTCIGMPGKYRATWRLKLASGVPPATTLLLLDVYAHDGFVTVNRRSQKNYGSLAISSADLEATKWQEKSIEFNYDGADMLEFRAFAKLLTRASVLLDTVTVERLDP